MARATGRSNVGNWRVKPDLYPAGFKPLSDALRASGRELMLWFEPERVIKGTEWYKEHHDWMFDTGGNTLLFNLGNPQARQFVTDFISDRIDEFGLGCYRQDFNMDPLPYWHAADAPDRQGMAESKHIEGLYAFWDDLLKRHPNLLIDNCASGGRRIDLETVGRATPFWRTDGPRDAIAHQCHTYGLMPWVPLSATSQDREGDDYEFRSSMCSALCINWAHSGDGPCERLRRTSPSPGPKRRWISISNCARITMATSTRSRAIPRRRCLDGLPTGRPRPGQRPGGGPAPPRKPLLPRPASFCMGWTPTPPIVSPTSIPGSRPTIRERAERAMVSKSRSRASRARRCSPTRR